MATKEGVCTRVFNEYGLMIDGSKDDLKRVVEPIPKKIELDETFKQWKERVLGGSLDIEVYMLSKPRGNMLISSILEKSSANHLSKIFSRLSKIQNKKLSKVVIETENKITEKYYSFSQNTLDLILEDLDGSIEPTIRDFFKSIEDGFDKEDFLKVLIQHVNKVAVEAKKIREKNEQLELKLLQKSVT